MPISFCPRNDFVLNVFCFFEKPLQAPITCYTQPTYHINVEDAIVLPRVCFDRFYSRKRLVPSSNIALKGTDLSWKQDSNAESEVLQSEFQFRLLFHNKLYKEKILINRETYVFEILNFKFCWSKYSQ